MPTTAFDGDTSNWIAILPVAAIEQHGPHLPLGNDAMIAQGLVERAASALPQNSPATFLPVQQVGQSSEHVNFAGTLTLGWQTSVQTLIDIGESVARAGLRKLVIITSHGGNFPAMEVAARELRVGHGMLVTNTSWEKLGGWREGAAKIDIHGGEIETSIMLALQPDLVAMQHAQDFPSSQSAMGEWVHLGFHSSNANIAWLAEDLNANGVTGNAAAATAERGEALIAQAVTGFGALIKEIAEQSPPDRP